MCWRLFGILWSWDVKSFLRWMFIQPLSALFPNGFPILTETHYCVQVSIVIAFGNWKGKLFNIHFLNFPTLINSHFTMAAFVFVLEFAGFQHGDLPFTLKRIRIAPVRNGPEQTFTFNIPFFLDHNDRAIQTYHFTTRSVHGIALDEPGLPYDLRCDVVHTALKSAICTSQRPLPSAYQPCPSILVLTKGTQKIQLLDSRLQYRQRVFLPTSL